MRRTLSAVITVSVVVITVQPAVATFPGGNGMIAYEDYDHGEQIHVIEPDGSGHVQLTFGARTSRRPVWSPDGSTIAFIRGNASLCIMNADGSGRTLVQGRITDGNWYFLTASWSPDATRIVLSTANEVARNTWDFKLYVVNVDSSGLTMISHGPQQDFSPSWSPDGTRIAFVNGRRRGRLMTMSPDGSNRTALDREGYNEYPDWSPDGSQITFLSATGRRKTDVFIIDSDGTGRTRLTDTRDRREFSPVFSPDGTRIAFSREQDPWRFDVFTMATDGSDVVRVTDTEDQDEWFLDWQAT